jgi:hypothetical protein
MTPNKPAKRVAFAPTEETPTPAKKQVGLKLDNSQSMTETLPKKPNPAEGQKQAEVANAKLNGYAKRAAELATNFKKIIEDKILPVNKSVIAKDVERSLIDGFVELGTEMNNDTREKEGMGSMGICALLLRTVFIQRDRINELDYAREQLEKRIAKLEANQSQTIDTPNKTG